MIDGSYFCPDLPETDSPRRKPAPGMIFEAQRDHRLDLARSYLVGDKASDIECGRNAGCADDPRPNRYGAHQVDCQADCVAPIGSQQPRRSSSEARDEHAPTSVSPFRARPDEQSAWHYSGALGFNTFPGQTAPSHCGQAIAPARLGTVPARKKLDHVIIATDDFRIAEAAFDWGAEVAMTSPNHRAGPTGSPKSRRR